MRLPRLAEGLVTPNERFYIRNHFPVPVIDEGAWRLAVNGLVGTPLSLSLDDLRRMPSQQLAVTLECAGNGRSFFRPPIEGEPWVLGAVSTAEWRGVPLSDVLDIAEVRPEATNLIFRGAESFERGLALVDVGNMPALLVYEMNGEPLPPAHGYPLRLIAPGWYAVASVKWLTELEITDRPYDGYFQSQRYVYEWTRGRESVTHQRVRSVITHPEDGDRLRSGIVTVRGLAWSGSAPVRRVEVSFAGGPWTDAELDESGRYAWRPWRIAASIERAGAISIRTRATDASGATQPEEAEWNRLGYGNNSIQTVTVSVS